ncbi:MAG: PLP-dependent aminotransferase family protein [Phycicoccus sp.]
MVDRWTPRIRGDGPVYLRVADAVADAVRTGRLRPGDRLPPQRALARRLGVTTSTVTAAYAEATRRHLVHGQVGRGTYVLGDSVDAALFATTLTDRETAPSTIDLASNVPAALLPDPDLGAALVTLGRSAGLDGRYASPAPLSRGHAVVATLLARRGLHLRHGEVVLAAGAQQALLAALVCAVGSGGRVLVEEPTFPGMKTAARHLGLHLVPVRLDHLGVLPGDLARAARTSGATTLVCVPHLQNPTAVSMTEQRRHDVSEVVTRLGLTVVEDDVYGALQDEPVLAALVPDRSVVVTGLSKSVAPGLRIGALAGRHPAVAAAAAEVSLTSWTVSPAMVELAALWDADGTLERRVDWQRTEVVARSRRLDDLRPGPRSPHRWLPTRTAPDRAARLLADAGVTVVPSTALGVGARVPKGVRLSLTAARSRAELHEAIERVRGSAVRWAP